MAGGRTALIAWGAGELSPKVAGRIDLDRFTIGLRQCLNFRIQPQGPASRRPGTVYAGTTRNAAAARLIPFIFGGADAHVLELSDGMMRVWDSRALAGSADAPFELATPYGAADLDALQFAQSADVMWIVHPDHQPRKLSRTGTTAWSIAPFAPTGNPFTGRNAYPRTVTLFEQRLWFGGTNSDPNKIWASQSGDFNQFTAGTTADSAFSYAIAGAQLHTIQWMSANRSLFIGTAGSILQADSTQRGPLTPTDIAIRPISLVGAAAVMAQPAKTAVLYVQRAGLRLQQIAYSLEADGTESRDITLVADHITGPGVTALAYQATPDSLLWALRADGVLAGLTYEPEEGVQAWHRHVLGGRDAVVESLAVIPKPDGSGDDLWLVVRRTVGGRTVRYVEYLADEFGAVTAIADAVFVDSARTYSGAATTTVSGLDHLEGETVDVLADGSPQAAKTVAGGRIALDAAAATVTVGLGFASRLETMPIEPGGPRGTSQGRPKAVTDLSLMVYRTVGGAVGSNGADPDDLKALQARWSEAIKPLTATIQQVPPGGFAVDCTVTVQQTQPLPMTIQAILPAVRVGG